MRRKKRGTIQSNTNRRHKASAVGASLQMLSFVFNAMRHSVLAFYSPNDQLALRQHDRCRSNKPSKKRRTQPCYPKGQSTARCGVKKCKMRIIWSSAAGWCGRRGVQRREGYSPCVCVQAAVRSTAAESLLLSCVAYYKKKGPFYIICGHLHIPLASCLHGEFHGNFTLRIVCLREKNSVLVFPAQNMETPLTRK